MNFMGADMVTSRWNSETRLSVGHVDQLTTQWRQVNTQAAKQDSQNPCVSFVRFLQLFLLTSFSLFLSLSVSGRAMHTVARPISDCAVAARLGPCCHTATVTPTATSTATLTPTTTMTTTAAATLPIVSFSDNDVAWRCPYCPRLRLLRLL